MHIGERIRELRNERGMSAEQLASKLGRGSQTVFRWEWRNTSPRYDDLLSIAKILEVPIGKLVQGAGEPSPSSLADALAAGAA